MATVHASQSWLARPIIELSRRICRHDPMPLSDRSRPAVGDQYPDKLLQLSDGTQTTVSALVGEDFLLVFVYRGGWCAFCLRRLVDYRDRINAFRRAKIRVVAISMDEPQASSGLKERLKLPFDLLCDADASLISSWDLVDARHAALPAAVLLDATRTVRWVSLDQGYAAASVDDVLKQCAAVVRGTALANEAPRRLRIPGILWWVRAARNELQFGRGSKRRVNGMGAEFSTER